MRQTNGTERGSEKPGTRTWKYWHGPRIRTDAPLMEKLDQQDDDQERQELNMRNVNARRVDNLARQRPQNGGLCRARGLRHFGVSGLH